jgi:hypothetical protein
MTMTRVLSTIRILPVLRGHDINNPDCWCRPTFLLVCDECRNTPGGLSRCNGWHRELTREEVRAPDVSAWIVHKWQGVRVEES